MAVIKCKMCGGDLIITEGTNLAECEYCGSRQTIPSADNEKKLNMFARANRMRMACEFDKAATVYASIAQEFPDEAEAYWGLVLCQFGIEYVDDPATGNKVPTCHRSSFESILENVDFENTLENADAEARKQYQKEGRQIEELRKRILAIAGKEPPYDIFICYKETAAGGGRTIDSVLAQDVYEALTEKGYRVFFSRITLEDKLGVEFEPYIFAALNSARIMLVFGTEYDHFNAVWVKNEWSRYLKIIAKDSSKHLIPCYKGIDAYDMPKEFKFLQAQDLGKVGATQDLLRGIQKLLPKGNSAAASAAGAQVVHMDGPSAQTLLKRGNDALIVGEWSKASGYFDKVLDMDADSVPALWGQALAALKAPNKETLVSSLLERKPETKLSKISAGSPDKKAEDWIIRENLVPYYLQREELTRLFSYDFEIYSYTDGFRKTSRELMDRLNNNRSIRLLVAKGDTQSIQEIQQIRQELQQQLDTQLQLYLQEDQKNKEETLQGYAQHLQEQSEAAAQLRAKAEQTREWEYQNAIADFEEARTPEAYKRAKEAFLVAKLREYKDSQIYAEKCDRAVDNIDHSEKVRSDRKVLTKCWIRFIFTVVIMAAYVFVALKGGLHTWAETNISDTTEITSGWQVLFILGGCVISTILLTRKILRKWNPIHGFLRFLKGIVSLALIAILFLPMFVLFFGLNVWASFLLSQLLLIPICLFSIWGQLKKRRYMCLTGSKVKCLLLALLTVAITVALFFIGGAFVDCTKVAFL